MHQKEEGTSGGEVGSTSKLRRDGGSGCEIGSTG